MIEEKIVSKDELIKRIKWFSDSVNYYFFDVFHLYEFELTIDSHASKDIRGCCFWCDIQDGAGMMSICYSTDWIQSEKRVAPLRCTKSPPASREAILSELQELSLSRFISEKDIPNAAHRVIRRMENIIFPMVKRNK